LGAGRSKESQCAIGNKNVYERDVKARLQILHSMPKFVPLFL
jgi:hypothetical protein